MKSRSATDRWAVMGPDDTTHYRRDADYFPEPLFEVLENRPRGYWLRRVHEDPERFTKAAARRAREVILDMHVTHSVSTWPEDGVP